MITPEQARAELQRRKQGATTTPVATSFITPEQARAELERRKAMPVAKPTIAQDFKSRTDKGADAIGKLGKGQIGVNEASLRLLGQGAGFIGDLTGKAISAITPDAIEDAVLKPVQALASSKFGKTVATGYNALPERARENIEAVGNVASILPIGKGASVAAKGATKTAMLPVKGATSVTREILGKTTGAGSGAISEGFRAAKEGGESAIAFKQGLRGEYSPEQLVDEARSGLKTVKDNRTASYVKQLEEIKAKDATAKALDVSPIVSEVDKQLTRFGVTKTPQGLDFSRSSLRFDKPAQQEIQTIVDEMAGFGLREGDRSVTGVDSLKRAVGSLYSNSSDARAFTQAIKSKTRDVLGKVEGYNKLSDDYVKNTEFIDDLTKNLSLGDKAAVETTYKKLTSALRQNNEFRKQLVDELDAAVGSKLSSKIAGQQLSPKLASGIAGSLTPALGTGLAFSGGGIPALLVGLAASSPRLVGEVVNALGYVGNKTKKVKDFLTNQKEIPFSARNAESSLSPAMTSKNINNSIITKTLPQPKNLSNQLSTPKEKGMFQTAIENLKNPSKRQGGYIANPLAKRELPVSKSSSVNNTTDLVSEAKKYQSAEEFVSRIRGSATQYGDYTPNLRHYGMEDYKNISELGVKPDEMVTIYRGLDKAKGKIKKQINDGDFVTTDFDSAASYSGRDNVVEMEVPAKTLYTDAVRDFSEEPFYTGSEYVYTKQKISPMTKSQLEDIWKQAQGKSLSNDLIEASVSSKLPPRTIPKSKPNFTPELKKNIAEIIDSQRGTKKISPEKMIELEADMTSIIEDFGFAVPKTKAAQIAILEKIFNGKI